MIPNVFVSSTIEDLQHLRDAVRETIVELGYNPIMSDYGDIGYKPTESAVDSCYATISDCQLAILMVGKRYGSIGQNNLSITHNEFRKARENSVPTISIIDQEVLSFKKVYDFNLKKGSGSDYPGMDFPEKTFSFIQEIMDSPINNGFLPYDTASKAKEQLKRQIAHLFGNLLSNQFDQIRVQVKDVLSEIKTLRHELLKDKGDEPIKYLKATKFILSENKNISDLRKLSERLYNGLDDAIPKLLSCSTFEDFVSKAGGKIVEISNSFDVSESALNLKDKANYYSFHVIDLNSSKPIEQNISNWALYDNKTLLVNKPAKSIFEEVFGQLKQEINLK